MLKKITYTLFITSFGLNAFANSNCSELEKRVAENYQNDVAKFNLAVCYNRNRDHDKAIKILKESLNKSPEYLKVKLELATSYYLNRNFKKSEKLLNEVLSDNNSIPRNTKNNIDYLLKNIKNIKTFGGSIELGVGYDDNVNYGTSSDTVSINNLDFVLSDSAKPENSTLSSLKVNLYKNFFINNKVSTKILGSYNGSDYTEDAVESYNVDIFNISSITTFSGKKFDSIFTLGQSLIKLDGEDFNDNFTASLTNIYKYSKFFNPEYTISRSKVDYKADSSKQFEGKIDSHKFAFQFNLFDKDNKNKLNAFVKPFYQYKRADLEEEYTSYDQNEYGIIYVQSFVDNIYFTSSYVYTRKDTDAIQEVYGKKRNTESDTVSFSLNKRMTSNLNAGLEYTNVNQRAQIETLKSTKEVYKFKISYIF